MEIILENINFSYNKVNYKKKNIFKDVNIILKSNNINGITGPSGSGKTTFALILSKINICEGEISEYNFGFVPENPIDYFVSSYVLGELSSSMKLKNYKPKDINKRIEDCIKIVGLDKNILKRRIDTLSSSESKFVSLASALIFNPDVLIIDNISEGLDELNKKNIIKLFRALKRNHKKNIIIIDKDIDFLHLFIDTLYVINNNNILEFKDRYNLFKDKKLMSKLQIEAPEIIKFENKVIEAKKVRLGYRNDLNDLIKDIYRLHENN